MTQTIATPATGTCDSTTSTTRSLLGYGVVAGPLYAAAVAAQAATRDGFDITRHAASLLSNGDLGWIQITTFAVTGLMSIAAAVGMHRALGSGYTWGPRLVGLWGVGLLAAAAFRADPMDGFPIGTPEGVGPVSWHGALHMVAAAVGFLGLVAACFVFARRFATRAERGWAAFSVITGAVFLAAFAGLASGSGNPAAVVAFWGAVVLAWAWVSALSAHLYRCCAG